MMNSSPSRAEELAAKIEAITPVDVLHTYPFLMDAAKYLRHYDDLRRRVIDFLGTDEWLEYQNLRDALWAEDVP